MSVIEVLKTIALCQGAYVFGITTVIFIYHVHPTTKSDKILRHYIVLKSLSYLGLLTATMISIWTRRYDLYDPWNYIVWSSYAVGDIALFKLLKYVWSNKK